ncbi:MAG: hypothetical protein AB1744_09230, partial [Candidatus Zixiibacteriota bacterium]
MIDTCNITISTKPIFMYESDKTDAAVYGNVYDQELLEQYDWDSVESQTLMHMLNSLPGYFSLVVEDKIRGITYVANDLFGNFRFYTSENDSGIHICDDWNTLVESARLRGAPTLIDK